MGPEHDARPRAFYDRESAESPPRRRRAAADWGVGEDIFDRMPSRRFARADRRAEHRDAVRPEHRVPEPAAGGGAAAREHGPAPHDAHDSSAGAVPATPAVRIDRSARSSRSWTVDEEPARINEGERPVESWLAPEPGKELALVPGESRTIVLAAPAPAPAPEPEDFERGDSPGAQHGPDAPAVIGAREAFQDDPREPLGRRTVVITGRPDRLPVARVQRPPRTAVERLGTRPDRIVAYSVALGFLLVLIAVLTTGQ